MKKLFTAFLMALAIQNSAAESRRPLGEFSRNQLDGWEKKTAEGETQYQLETMGNLTVLKANSQASYQIQGVVFTGITNPRNSRG
ncbi:MAG: hypothetical protein ACXW01_06560 [Methylobacter sp.]